MERTDRFIIILYIALSLFFLYRLIKGQKNKKNLSGNVAGFQRKASTLEMVLFGVLLVTGLVNLFFGVREGSNVNATTAATMVALAIVFALTSKSKMYIGENGLLANSNFYTYKELKKWGFDPESHDLVLQVKKDNQMSNEVFKVEKKDIEEINTLIRRYKLNK